MTDNQHEASDSIDLHIKGRAEAARERLSKFLDGDRNS